MIENNYNNIDWLSCPKNYIAEKFENNSNYLLNTLRDDFKEKIENYSGKISLLNYSSIDDIKNHSLVCFRGFVNDMNNPNYAVKTIRISSDNGEYIEKFSLFSDFIESDTNDIETDSNNLIERQSFQLLSLLHENNWVKNELKLKFDLACEKSNINEINMHVYGALSDLKLHDVVEAYGIFENTSAIFQKNDPETSNSSAKLFLSLHCIYVKILSSPSPYSCLNSKEFNFDLCRQTLLRHLTKTLSGDELSAKFLLLNMISHVGMRVSQRPIGKFVVNLCLDSKSTYQQSDDLRQSLLEFTINFLSHSFIYTLTQKNLETDISLTKNYETGSLTGNNFLNHNGIYLIVDELELTECTLKDNACKNILYLQDLINFQKTSIDFLYYKIDYERDLPVLLLSKGRSILPFDSQVTWKPNSSAASDFNFINVPFPLLRQYFAYVRDLSFSIGAEEEQLIQRCYINPINKSRLGLNENRLHVLLTMARLNTKSYGRETLEPRFWQEIMEMELERCQRIKKFKNNDEEELLDR